jgi:hypothetical protein
MVSVLLLTSFVTKVYAAETSDLGVPSSGGFNEVKITLSGFPGQTGESVTDVDLIPSPCSSTCTGFSDITIPGIGDGHLLVTLQHHQKSDLVSVGIVFIFAVLLAISTTLTHTLVGSAPGENVVTVPINIHDIGTGQVTIQLL